MSLNFSDFEPRIILKLFLNATGVTSPKNLRNIFQSLLMFYYIIKLKRISESGIRTRIQKDFYVLMKLRKSICFASIVQMHTRKQNYN